MIALVLVGAGGLAWYLTRADQTIAEASLPLDEVPSTPEPEPDQTIPAPVPVALTFAERFAQYRDEDGHAEELYALSGEARTGGDVETALAALSLAAQRNSAAANLEIGRRYDPGIAVAGEREFAPQPLSAARYYCRAVALGDPEASGLLANLRSRAAAPPREEADLFADFPADYECSA